MSFYVLAVSVLIGIAALLLIDALLRVLRPPVPPNFGAMLARHGIDWTRVASVAGESCVALDRCAYCDAKQRCGEWLSAEGRGADWHFCPNARFFERLKVAAQR